MTAYPFIPRNTRFSGRTWLTALLVPICALLIAYLLTVVSLALLPNLMDLLEMDDSMDDMGLMLEDAVASATADLPGIWQRAFLILVASLGVPITLAAQMSVSIGYPGIPDEQATMDASMWAMPLTLTVIIASTIVWAHRREGRRIRNSQPLVWLPALISGAVTGLVGVLLTLPKFVDVSIDQLDLSDLMGSIGAPSDTADIAPTLSASLTVGPSAVYALLGGFAVGFLAAALGRLSSVPAKRELYAVSSIPTLGPTVVQAIRITLGTILGGTIISGAYLTTYALFNLDGAPASIIFALFPFFINLGLIGMIGALGGSGSAVIDVMDEYDSASGLLFESASWYIQVPMALLIIAIVIGAGLKWARTRDPRFERNVLGHFFLPVFFLLAGTCAIALNQLAMSLSADMSGEAASATISAQVSWTGLLWYLGMGLIIEGIATISRPSPLVPTYIPQESRHA
ncbi:MAG: hypothetical protein ACTHW1_02155 [Ancrocorticia sp.]|uniref:hypothetical protein n=1 Tax=Ancrocorticia sp. TaxID=2593684 RepID=UPI003F9297EF